MDANDHGFFHLVFRREFRGRRDCECQPLCVPGVPAVRFCRGVTNECAPGRPISRVLSWAVISLGRRLPAASSGPPGARTGRAAPCRGNPCGCPYVAPAWPCSRWGLPGRPGHPGRRWSLTPPFHPYRVGRGVDRYLVYGRIGRMLTILTLHPLPIYQFTRLPPPNPAVCFCGPIRRVTPPGRYPAPCPVEPGLSSPRACAERDRLADLEPVSS